LVNVRKRKKSIDFVDVKDTCAATSLVIAFLFVSAFNFGPTVSASDVSADWLMYRFHLVHDGATPEADMSLASLIGNWFNFSSIFVQRLVQIHQPNLRHSKQFTV
jgi:hypothetical protein